MRTKKVVRKTPVWNKGLKIDRTKHPNFGHFQKHSEETKLNWSKARKGKKLSQETRKKIGEGLKRAYKEGRKFTVQRTEGDYVGFTNSLKEQIRAKGDFRCQICFVWKKRGLHVHHIDYDKTNQNSENLIALCHSCHVKTNGKRDFWKNYFKKENLNSRVFKIIMDI